MGEIAFFWEPLARKTASRVVQVSIKSEELRAVLLRPGEVVEEEVASHDVRPGVLLEIWRRRKWKKPWINRYLGSVPGPVKEISDD